jgi:hypothetical protein
MTRLAGGIVQLRASSGVIARDSGASENPSNTQAEPSAASGNSVERSIRNPYEALAFTIRRFPSDDEEAPPAAATRPSPAGSVLMGAAYPPSSVASPW